MTFETTETLKTHEHSLCLISHSLKHEDVFGELFQHSGNRPHAKTCVQRFVAELFIYCICGHSMSNQHKKYLILSDLDET